MVGVVRAETHRSKCLLASDSQIQDRYNFQIMKKLIVPAFLIGMLMASPSFVAAPVQIISVAQDNGHPVKPEELPKAIKDALAYSYKGWTVKQAVLVSGGASGETTAAPGTVNTNPFYELSVNNGKEDKVLRFYQDGTPMK